MMTATTSLGELSIVAAQYESLRRAALGGELPPETRAGLLLFLRRGMWAWTRALAAGDTWQPPTVSGTANEKTQGQYATVIHIFAAMAINATQKGAAP
jgi:hypothetical protein